MPTSSQFIVRNFFGFGHLNMADCDKRQAGKQKKAQEYKNGEERQQECSQGSA
jgi:hypothetical protein